MFGTITMISVIIPTYNRAKIVREAVESVLPQTYRNFEIIVVDDGSTDDTYEVLENYIREKKIVYHYQKNSGVACARNQGIKLSQGDYIAFLDSDDLWVPNKLERQMKLFEKNVDSGVVYSWAFSRAANGNIKISRPSYKGYLFERLLLGNLIPNVTVVFKKRIVEKIGFFDERLKRSEDWDFWLRASEHFHFDFVPEILVEVRSFGDTITKKAELLDQTFLVVLDKVFSCGDLPAEVLALKRHAYANRYLDYMTGYYRHNMVSKVWLCFMKSLWLCPKAINARHVEVLSKSLLRPLFRGNVKESGTMMVV